MDTFVLRLWKPRSGEPGDDGLRGTVMHVISGRSAPFSSEAELLAFVREAARLEDGTPHVVHGG